MVNNDYNHKIKVRHINQLGELLDDLEEAYKNGDIVGAAGVLRHKDGYYITFWINVPLMEGLGALEIAKTTAVIDETLGKKE